jgi:diguanylate cyclase (GGDEF)-like protein
MSAAPTTAAPTRALHEDPEELTLRLERVGSRLVGLAREGPGRKIAEPLMGCVQELRVAWSALRELSLVYDANRVEAMLAHERELRQAMEILNGTVDSLSRANDRTVASVDRQLHELDRVETIGDTELMAQRLRSVTGSVREAATEMRDDLARSAASLDEGEQIISAVDRKLRAARRQVMHDSLTRVLSRAAFDRRLGELAAQSSAVTGAWCLALADIDGLTAINETHGRRVGDALLCKVAEIIQSTCETLPGSAVGRYRGKQFAILLPRCPLREGQRMGEEIREAVGKTKWESKVAKAAVIATTVSIGIVQHRKDEAAAPLTQRVDACLEQAKRRGRDRVVAEA